MAQGFSLKDQLFNAETVGQLGDHFEAAGVFASASFVRDVLAEMAPLELKARINLIADVLARYLPVNFLQAAAAIHGALPPPLDPARSDDDFGHFIYAALGVFVENQGIDSHLRESLDLLEEITQRFSMEFSIRAFLNRWPDQTLERMRDWINHDHYHVRRLVSEGTRPKLPWGQGIGLTPGQTMPLLDRLHDDPTRFVTRSVANHLNDITKSTPDQVLERLDQWVGANKQDRQELSWMRKHALRGLIKAGHSGAMTHLGYRPDAPVTVNTFGIAPETLPRGATAEITIDLMVDTDCPLIIDYVIDYVKANGKTAPKTSKCKVVDAKVGKPLQIAKKHHFKDNATTFTLHPGLHMVHLQVNGRKLAAAPFTLT